MNVGFGILCCEREVLTLVDFVDEPELAADTLVWLTRERRKWLAGRYVSYNWDMEELDC